MAFTLQAIVGSTTVNLTNGAPFKLLSATGMGGAPVRRVTARGPAQQGDTDLGYRLQAREIELQIGFTATTDALLDGYRDTLTSIFKPTASTPVQLRVTRDDAEVRALDCYTVGVLQIDLVPDHRPGHYHVATVQLRASNPTWYSVTPGTVSVIGSASPDTEWWLAGGAIGSANVLMYGTAPAQGEAWSYTGTVSDRFTLVFRSARELFGTATKYAFRTTNSNFVAPLTELCFVATNTSYAASDDGSRDLGLVAMKEGTHTYFLRQLTYIMYNPTTGNFDDKFELHFSRHDSGTAGVTFDGKWENFGIDLIGSTGIWRAGAAGSAATYWDSAIDRYALYDTFLSASTSQLLHRYMDNQIGDGLPTLAVPYEGDVPEYPTIRITGPVTGAVITNENTGDALDFGTITIGSGAVYNIDTRHGYKSVTLGTVQKRSELSADSDLGTWHLVPTADGVNVLTLGGSAIGPTTKIEVVYYNRYLSF